MSLESIEECIATLEAIVAEPALITELDEPTRRRLLEAAGRISKPERHERRMIARAHRKKDQDTKKRADSAILESTGIRAARREPVFLTPELEPLGRSEVDEAPPLHDAQRCYVCKTRFHHVHFFYDQMCASCAELNWQKRNQTSDLSGRYALLTGARVKIGYHAAIKLLRAGAHVIVTTRFPRDAAKRYSEESDFEDWKDRLEIHGLDFRHTPSVEALCHHLLETLPRLDYLINNACQTVRRPPAFYAHMMELEAEHHHALPPRAHSILESWESHRAQRRHALARENGDSRAGILDPAALSQVALLPEDRGIEPSLFPEGQLDADLQQVDLRDRNSWRLALDEVSSVELLEVQLINAVAPYVLNARLKPLMLRVPTPDKHIVNVSAMEGQFYRAWKTDKHPHTNMAKAALNMMTRTSDADYLKDGIHMNSVDTGWITDEDPVHIASKKAEEHGFSPPLDVVDGAARIVDPIFHGELTGEHMWGLFLKDYKPTRW